VGEFDTVAVTGNVKVGGTLRMSITAGSAIQAGDTIEIISAGSFTAGSRFKDIETIGLDDYFFAVNYPDAAVASLGSGSALGSGQSLSGPLSGTLYEKGDMNHDGAVDSADISYFAIASAGDLGGPEGMWDGKLTFDDINAFAAKLGMSQGAFVAAMQAPVPEPSSLTFVVVYGLLISSFRPGRQRARMGRRS
jgi:hypothetical protein